MKFSTSIILQVILFYGKNRMETWFCGPAMNWQPIQVVALPSTYMTAERGSSGLMTTSLM